MDHPRTKQFDSATAGGQIYRIMAYNALKEVKRKFYGHSQQRIPSWLIQEISKPSYMCKLNYVLVREKFHHNVKSENSTHLNPATWPACEKTDFSSSSLARHGMLPT